MKIESVRIQNFRSFKDETISFDDHTCLVGPNGGGKSTVLCALNIFFRETENSATDVVSLVAEDFHRKDPSEPIIITVTFKDLSEAAKVDFKEYFRQDRLIISAYAEFNPTTKRADVKQRGKRLAILKFAPFFREYNNGALVSPLRDIYQLIRADTPDLPDIRTREGMRTSLQEYEKLHPEECQPIWSSDEFYGVSRGANRLAKHVQWVYVPAVKNIPLEQNETKSTALGKLLARTVRLKVRFDDEIGALKAKAEGEYRKILDDHRPALDELQKVIEERFGVWAHPGATVKLQWQRETSKNVEIAAPVAFAMAGEGAFEGDMLRLGHGLQRSYLLALLEVLTGIGDGELPTLILGCEEPELYQHPPQAKHMAFVLEELSQKGAQVMITTHNPVFVTGRGFENVRLLRFKTSDQSSHCKALSYDELAARLSSLTGEETPLRTEGVAAKLHQILQPGMNDIFFTKNLVLVEGLEDVATITSWMVLNQLYEDFRRKGIHIVPVNGKHNLIQPLAIAQGLGIPVFTVFDADGRDEKHRGAHERDNKRILALLGGDPAMPFPESIVWGNKYIVWPDNITTMIEGEMTSEKYLQYKNEAEAIHGQPGGLEKNILCIGTRLRIAHENETRPASLDRMCKAILDTAEI